MTRNHEIRPDLDDGIDREVLVRLRKRFLSLNQARLGRAMEGFASRQRLVLTLLPLFFHVNHPLLPGYVSGFTPAGIANYEPDDEALGEAQRLTRSFAYKARRDKPPTPILGLYLMGSLGTLAQADQSDMDVWVCHASDIPPAALDELARKCQLLEVWAASQGAEAHFFLIDCQRFVNEDRDNRLSSDDSGTTQHYLLLDEFYRTAIWLAGRMPLWWFVPVYEEQRYAQFSQGLLLKRFIREEDVLDLGHLARIPPGEFVGAGLWQLFKGLESPYKSVLKLLLTEVYADEHPQVNCVSLQLKQAVYANHLDLDELDPYIMVYRRIEAYLQRRNEPERLELVRRSLYLKVNKKLSLPSRSRAYGWQRETLGRLVREWGWDDRQLALLDSRSQWKVRQVISERSILVRELNFSYRFLTRFAKTQHMDSPVSRKDLNVLGRRLYAAFERRAGKLEIINPGIAPDLAEDTLTLVQSPNRREPGQTHWGLYNGNLNALEWEHFAPIKRSHDLVQLIAWSHRNGVIDASTRLALHPGSSDLSEYELFNVLGALQQTIALAPPLVSEEHLLQPAIAKDVLLLINVGIDPLRHHRELNILMTTERTDSLSYAGVRDNLVLTLDQVTVNTWNEVLTERFDGEYALLDCLRDYLNALPTGRNGPSVRVRCFCHNRAHAIAARVEALLLKSQDLLAQNRGHRLLIQVREHYHVLELSPGEVRYETLEDLTGLLGYLAAPQAAYRPLQLDAHALQGHDLAMMLPLAQPHTLQVFYSPQGSEAQVLVLDEHATLWQQRMPYHDEASLLLPLQRFFHSLALRRDTQQDATHGRSLEVVYYRVVPATPAMPRHLERRAPPQSAGLAPFFDVQAIIHKGKGQRTSVVLYCNQQEFSELEHGDALFEIVAQEILEHRRDSSRYRCYITDLDLSALGLETRLSTTAYLKHKQRLELALNAALQQRRD